MHPKVRRLVIPKVIILGIVTATILLLVMITKLISVADGFIRQTGITPATAFRLFVDSGVQLKASDDRTNILLLGIGGGAHDGPDLTDSMIVASYQYKTQTLSIISLPRDIWSVALKDKINSAYHYGEEKKKGGGLVLAKVISEDVVGLPVHYAFVLDFSQFQKAIDIIGGIDVDVGAAFTDPEYPIEGKEEDLCNGDKTYKCRYETVRFDAGLQHMDGKRALVYVRSRHAEGKEGTDFSRGNRQQEVLVAVKKKITNPDTWKKIDRMKDIIKAFDDSTDTDMLIGELLTLGKFIARVKQEQIHRISIEDLLVSPPLWMYDGKYVLVPMENFSAIHGFIREKLQ